MQLSFKTQARITYILTFSFIIIHHYKKQFKSKRLKICITKNLI